MKNKHQKLLLSSLLSVLLMSCSQTSTSSFLSSSSSTTNFESDGTLTSSSTALESSYTDEELINNLKKYLRNEIGYEGTYTSKTTYDSGEVSTNSYTLKSYLGNQNEKNCYFYDYQSEYYSYSYYYVEGNDGLIYKEQLTKNNEIESIKVNEDNTFISKYSNPFNSESLTYKLSSDKSKVVISGYSDIESLSTSVGLIMAGNSYGMNYSSFIIDIDKQGKPISATLSTNEEVDEYRGSVSIDSICLTFKSFSDLGLSFITPKEDEEKEELKAFFNSLKNNNYTYEFYEPFTILYKNEVTSKGITITSYNLTDKEQAKSITGYVSLDDNKSCYVKMVEQDNKVILKGAKEEFNYPLSDLLPDFDISTSFFSKDGDTYTLVDYENSYSFISSIMPESYYLSKDSVNYIVKGSYKITLNDDKALVTYDISNGLNTYTLYVSYSNIGTTTFSYDLSTYEKYEKPTSWEAYDENIANDLDEVFVSRNNIPFIFVGDGWDYVNVDKEKKIFTLGAYIEDMEEAFTLFNQIQQIILQAGFAMDEETGNVVNSTTNIGARISMVGQVGNVMALTVEFYDYTSV